MYHSKAAKHGFWRRLRMGVIICSMKMPDVSRKTTLQERVKKLAKSTDTVLTADAIMSKLINQNYLSIQRKREKEAIHIS